MDIHGRFSITHDFNSQSHIIKLIFWDESKQGQHYEFGLKLPNSVFQPIQEPDEVAFAGLGTFPTASKGEKQ